MIAPHPVSLRERIQSCQAIAFDFDGTLVDSNTIKRQAFDTCFAEFPEKRSEIHDYCYHNNHTPRWEKFQHVTEAILKIRYTPEWAQELHKRYEAATTRQVIEAPEIPGAMNFLRQLPASPILLLSSTPHPILLHILKARKMASFFSIIQGAPLDKAAWLIDYEQSHHLDTQKTLFFGDSPEDAEAARKAGWPFIAVANSAIEGTPLAFLKDFKDLL